MAESENYTSTCLFIQAVAPRYRHLALTKDHPFLSILWPASYSRPCAQATRSFSHLPPSV
jgi:hypothetical protein